MRPTCSCTRRCCVPRRRPIRSTASTARCACRSTPRTSSAATTSSQDLTMKNLSYFLFAAAIGYSGVASANAFNINEHDASATGRGGATVASNTSPSSVVFNPGGIAVAEGTNFQLGGSLILAKGAYTPIGGGEKTSTDSSPAIVPNMHV